MTKKKPHGHNFGGTSKQKRRKKNKSKWVFSVTNSKVFGLTHSKYLECSWIYVSSKNEFEGLTPHSQSVFGIWSNNPKTNES